MSSFCIHADVYAGSRYESPDIQCDIDYDDICGEDCPYRKTEEDCAFEEADRLYDDYKSFL